MQPAIAPAVASSASFLAVTIGLLAVHGGAFQALTWLPAGVATAVLVRGGVPLWPWLALGILLASLAVGQPLQSILLHGVIATLLVAPMLIAVSSSTCSHIRARWLEAGLIVAAVALTLAATGAVSLALALGAAWPLGQVAGGQRPFDSVVVVSRIWGLAIVLVGVTLFLRVLLARREAAEERLREAEVQHRIGLLEAARAEQERLGREMHDALGQQLTGLALMLRTLEHRATGLDGETALLAREAAEHCDLAIGSARSLAHGLVAPYDGQASLAEGLRALRRSVPESTGLQLCIEAADACDPGPKVATELYRIAQGALSNCLRHSRAREVRIAPDRGVQGVRLSVADDGCGITADRLDRTAGVGLSTMRQRAALIGGQLSIDSAIGRGTRVVCEVGAAP